MVESARRIVIVGGGFAGAEVARQLLRHLPSGWEVVVLSRENHLVFTPLLAEVVGATIDPRHVVWPVREMARGAACRTVTVKSLDFAARTVTAEVEHGGSEELAYDQLVLACGMRPRTDLVPGMAEHGWPLKTLGDAIALRNHVIGRMERAEARNDAAEQAVDLSFAVVGGGFTGIELAGSLQDLLVDGSRSYQRFGPDDVRVTVVHGPPHLLQPMPEALAEYARRLLVDAGLDIRTGLHVERVERDAIVLPGGERIPAGTTIGAVGNATLPLIRDSGLTLERGRVVVDGTMRVPDHPGVWALGDCAAVPNALDGSTSPTLGQFALRQARQLADNIVAVVRGGEPQPFHYHTKGMFAALGHRKAVGNPFGMRVTGLLAFLLWRAIYWAKLPSGARKLQVAFDWSWSLFFRRDIVMLDTSRTRPDDADD